MTKPAELKRLAEVAQVMLDHRLDQLRGTAAELDRSRMQRAALDQASNPADLDPVMAAKVALVYDRWADHRRSELNLVIARQTAAWLDARGEAQTAFGRVQALQGLATRLKDRR